MKNKLINRKSFLSNIAIFILSLSVIPVFQVTLHGQNYDKKAILAELSKPQPVKKEITLLWSLAGEMQTYNTDSALILGYRAIQMARNINYQEGLSKSLGIVANVYSRMGNYPKAMALYLEKLKLEESGKNPRNLASVLLNIGILFFSQKEYIEALRYYKKADSLIIENKINDLIPYININLGDTYDKINIIDSAKYFYEIAYQDAIQTMNKNDEAVAHIGLGNVYSKMGNEYSAIENYNKAIPVLKERKDFEFLSETYLGLAKVHNIFGNEKDALINAKLALNEANKIESLAKSYEAGIFITQFYKKLHMPDSAFKYLELSIAFNDSINSRNNIKNMQLLTINEKLRQEDISNARTYAKKQRNKQLQLLFITIFIPTLFLLTLLLRKRKVKQSVVKILGIVSLMFAFEFITLLTHPMVAKVTNYNLILEIIIFVILGFILVPTHHRLEHWLIHHLIKERMTKENKIIQESIDEE